MSTPIRPRRTTLGGVRVRQPNIQTRVGDEPFGAKVRCEAHLIEYYQHESADAAVRRGCPMCALEGVHDQVRAALVATEEQLRAARNELNRLKPVVDVQSAIRSAIELLDDHDYEWLKVQMYLYKLDRSVMLKPTHGKRVGGQRVRRGAKLPPNGFMAVPKAGEPEAHLVTSVGGVVIAECLDEAITCFGPQQAMGLMLKAWWKALPGGQA